jgi:hypothetical protein
MRPQKLIDRVEPLYAIAGELSRQTGRSFTPDGHRVGSIGEVLAADFYGLELRSQSNEGYDAVKRENWERSWLPGRDSHE